MLSIHVMIMNSCNINGCLVFFLVELKLKRFKAPLTGMPKSRTDRIQWSFRAPPASVCMDDITVLVIEGSASQKIAFQLGCNVIKLTILLDKSASETVIVYPLQGMCFYQ